MTAILQTQGLTKHYGSESNLVKALDGVDLTVLQGEFVATLSNLLLQKKVSQIHMIESLKGVE